MVVEGTGLHDEDILVFLVLNCILDIYDSGPRGKPIQLCLQNIRPCFCLKHSNRRFVNTFSSFLNDFEEKLNGF